MKNEDSPLENDDFVLKNADFLIKGPLRRALMRRARRLRTGRSSGQFLYRNQDSSMENEDSSVEN